MPRIPPPYLLSSVYLYRSLEEATSGEGDGATGFLVGVYFTMEVMTTATSGSIEGCSVRAVRDTTSTW